MTITIEIAPELEHQIKQAAAREGLSPDAYILDSVAQRLQQPGHRTQRTARLSRRESELLQRINQSLSQIQWSRYRVLVRKRQAEMLTDEEYAELLAFSDRIEEANVSRIQHLAELAEIRNTTLPELMKELGIKPVAYG